MLGLAGECALRVILMRYNNSIDYAHKIAKQYEEAVILTGGGNKLLVDAAKDVTLLVKLWHNEDRYETVETLYAKRFRDKALRNELNISDADSKKATVVSQIVKKKMQDIVLGLGKAAQAHE